MQVIRIPDRDGYTQITLMLARWKVIVTLLPSLFGSPGKVDDGRLSVSMYLVQGIIPAEVATGFHHGQPTPVSDTVCAVHRYIERTSGLDSFVADARLVVGWKWEVLF